MLPLHKDLFIPTGRTPRLRFGLALGLTIAFWYCVPYIMNVFGTGLLGTLISLLVTFLAIYLLYTVYVRRLHDFGQSAGVFFATCFLFILTIVVVLGHAGLAEYFQIMADNPEIANDETAAQALAEKYQAKVKENVPWAGPASLIPFYVLTVVCAIWPSNKAENKYGVVPAAAAE